MLQKKTGSRRATDSFGSPAFSVVVGETRGFPSTPHDVVGLSGTLATCCGLACFPLSVIGHPLFASAISDVLRLELYPAKRVGTVPQNHNAFSGYSQRRRC